MTLPTSGPLTFSMILGELGRPGPLSFNHDDARALCGVPTGIVKLSDFYGKTKYVAPPPPPPPPPVSNRVIDIPPTGSFVDPTTMGVVVSSAILSGADPASRTYRWIIHYTNGPLVDNLNTDVITIRGLGVITLSCEVSDSSGPATQSTQSTYTLIAAAVPAGTLLDTVCVGFDWTAIKADGNGGSYQEIVEANSAAYCGYVPPAPFNPIDFSGMPLSLYSAVPGGIMGASQDAWPDFGNSSCHLFMYEDGSWEALEAIDSTSTPFGSKKSGRFLPAGESTIYDYEFLYTIPQDQVQYPGWYERTGYRNGVWMNAVTIDQQYRPNIMFYMYISSGWPRIYDGDNYSYPIQSDSVNFTISMRKKSDHSIYNSFHIKMDAIGL